ncbi:MAG: helix-turn-helix transcriptional regulator [Gracilimonas sp.]
MPYLTDKELTERFEYYTVQVEKLLLQGEDIDSVLNQSPFGVHLNDAKTLEVLHVNKKLTEVIGFHNNEIKEMGMEYLENYLHPDTLSNVAKFLPPIYENMNSHETYPFLQHVLLHDCKDFSPLITFSKTTSFQNGLVVCLSLRPGDFENMSPKMEQVVEMDSFKLKHFKRFQQLSEREVEVLTLLANGKNNPRIAKELYLSRHTVETHRKNIKRKLDLKNFRDLMRYAIAFDLVRF